MFAVIIESFGTYAVKAPGRIIDGFKSLDRAAEFIENRGWILWNTED